MSYRPQGFGAKEPTGDVWEWVECCWHASYKGAPDDGSAWEENPCSQRVVRGGSWFNDARLARSAYRDGFPPGYRDDDVGFRYQRLDERTLPGADFAEETQVDDACLLSRGQFLQFALRLAHIDAGRLGIAQPRLDLVTAQRGPGGRLPCCR